MAPIIDGYWGPPTSTIDWCEENYSQTVYIAEFWNTVSNLAMIIPSLWGLYFTRKNNLHKRFILCFISILLVGIGSWNFHMTLLYEMQLFDEIPMIWGSLTLVYCLLIVYYPKLFDKNNINNNRLLLLKLSLISYGIITLLIYLYLKIPILFQSSYVVLVSYMLYLTILIVKYRPCNRHVCYAATFFYYFGSTLWLIDNFYCKQLNEFRQRNQFIPFLVNPLTQLHAWWHLFAGYGSYLYILFTIHSTYAADNIADHHHSRLRFRFKWYVGLMLDTADCSVEHCKQNGFDKNNLNGHHNNINHQLTNGFQSKYHQKLS